VQCGGDAGVAEPGGDLAELGAVGVVEVMTRGEEFDGARARVFESVEQAGVQAMGEEDVRGDSWLHKVKFKGTSRGGVEIFAMDCF
jgi:hypothetical protein